MQDSHNDGAREAASMLHQAMKALAVGKTDSQRQRVYQLLMITDLHIALQPESRKKLRAMTPRNGL